jgi:hypothetical protein
MQKKEGDGLALEVVLQMQITCTLWITSKSHSSVLDIVLINQSKMLSPLPQTLP